jgi:hypothetical protein
MTEPRHALRGGGRSRHGLRTAITPPHPHLPNSTSLRVCLGLARGVPNSAVPPRPISPTSGRGPVPGRAT